MAAPVLLRLAGDRFMDDLRAQLADDPEAIAALRAKPRSHRVRPPGRPADWEPAGAPARPLKLYGAVHGEYNLVAASLVCGVGGPARAPPAPRRGRPRRVRHAAAGRRRQRGGLGGRRAGRRRPAPSCSPARSSCRCSRSTTPATRARRASCTSGSCRPPAWRPGSRRPRRSRRTRPRRSPRRGRLGEMRQLVETYRTLVKPEAWVGPLRPRRQRDGRRRPVADRPRRLPHALAPRGVGGDGRARHGRPRGEAAGAPGSPTGRRWPPACTRRGREREALLGETGGARETLALHLDTLRTAGKPLPADDLAGLLLTAKGNPDAPVSATAGVSLEGPRAPRRPKLDPSGQVEYVIRCVYLRPHCADWHGPIVSAPTESASGSRRSSTPTRPRATSTSRCRSTPASRTCASCASRSASASPSSSSAR